MDKKQGFAVEDVARFMFEESQKGMFLDQEMTAALIKDKFGPEFVSITDNLGLSIRDDVRKAFRVLVDKAGQRAEWSSRDKCWHLWPKKN